MTVAQLRQRVDKRFDAVDERFNNIETQLGQLHTKLDSRFDSMNEKLTAILHAFDKKYRHHDNILHEHDERIKDLERPTGT